MLEGGYALEGRNSAFRRSVAAHLRALVRDDDDYDDDGGYPFCQCRCLCKKTNTYFWLTKKSTSLSTEVFKLKV